MQNEKIHIYFVPGLAANPTIFDLIRLPKKYFEFHFLEWLLPENSSETIEHYAQRMSANVKHENVVLIGVSFGGVMVQEMKKIVNPLETIIISSIKNKNEMPLRMRIAQKTNAHKILPTKAFTHLEKYEKYAFGNLLKGRIQLYKKYLSMRDEKYVQWAINTIVNWRQTKSDEDVVHIHGTSDFMFPIENITNCHKIEGGTHIMILTKAKEINVLLQKVLQKKSDEFVKKSGLAK